MGGFNPSAYFAPSYRLFDLVTWFPSSSASLQNWTSAPHPSPPTHTPSGWLLSQVHLGGGETFRLCFRLRAKLRSTKTAVKSLTSGPLSLPSPVDSKSITVGDSAPFPSTRHLIPNTPPPPALCCPGPFFISIAKFCRDDSLDLPRLTELVTFQEDSNIENIHVSKTIN